MFLLILCFLASDVFAAMTATSFPNAVPSGSYVFQSYEKRIYTDFPFAAAPGSEIKINKSPNGDNYYISNPQDIQIINHSPLEGFAGFRLDITDNLMSLYPETGALAAALVLGNRHFLAENFSEYVRYAGQAHIMALSGLHLAVFAGFFFWILQIAGVPFRYIGILTLPVSVLYLFVGGMGVPLQRAVLFHALAASYAAFRIPAPPFYVFAGSLIMHAFVAGGSVFTLSFVMSYGAVLGIIIGYKAFRDVLSGWIKADFLSSMLAVSLAASLIVNPVVVYNFGMYNYLGIFAGLIILPMMPLILIFCFTALLLSIFGIRLEFVDFFIQIFYNVILKISEFCALNGLLLFADRIFWAAAASAAGILIFILAKRNYVER